MLTAGSSLRGWYLADEPVTTLVDNGDYGTRIDVVIVGDGYGMGTDASATLESYYRAVERNVLPIFDPAVAAARGLHIDPVFARYHRFFNLHRVNLGSVAVGTPDSQIASMTDRCPVMNEASRTCDEDLVGGRAFCSRPIGGDAWISDFEKVKLALSRTRFRSRRPWYTDITMLDVADLVIVLNATPGGRAIAITPDILNRMKTPRRAGDIPAGGGRTCGALCNDYPWYCTMFNKSLMELARYGASEQYARDVNLLSNLCYTPVSDWTAFRPITTIPSDGSPDLIMHELGHMLGSLGDEYSRADTGSAGTPRWEITASFPQWAAACKSIPLRYDLDLLDRDVPNLDLQGNPAQKRVTCHEAAPPEALNQITGAAVKWFAKWWSMDAQQPLGAFVGGGYLDEGVYRPTACCRMRVESQDFCPVCREHLVKSIYAHRDIKSGSATRRVSAQGVMAFDERLVDTWEDPPTWPFSVCPEGKTPSTSALCRPAEDARPRDTGMFVISRDPGHAAATFQPNSTRAVTLRAVDRTSWVRDRQQGATWTCQSCVATSVWTLTTSGPSGQVLACAHGEAGCQPDPSIRIVGREGEVFTAIAVGDVDGSLANDIVLGAKDTTELGRAGAGKVYIILDPIRGPALPGRFPLVINVSNPPAGVRIAHILGAFAGDQAGASLAVANVDGIRGDDLAIGAPGATREGRAGRGAVYLLKDLRYLQQPGAVTGIDLRSVERGLVLKDKAMTVWGDDAGGNAGHQVSFADVLPRRNDQETLAATKDLLFSAPHAGIPDAAGVVYVLENSTELMTRIGDAGTHEKWTVGAADVFPKIVTIRGTPGDRLGSAIAAVKFDGEGGILKPPSSNLTIQGGAELAVGAPGALGGNGAVYIITRLDSLEEATLDLSLVDWAHPHPQAAARIGSQSMDQAGTALAAADVNRDGVEDLIIGAPKFSGGGETPGRVYVVYGGNRFRGGLLFSLPASMAADEPLRDDVAILGYSSGGAEAGSAVAAGDMQADYFPDVVVGLPGFVDDQNQPVGSVYLERGGNGLYGQRGSGVLPDFVVRVGRGVRQLGTTLAMADLDGNSRADLFISGSADGKGAVFVILGR
jgi:hypothetical protein